MKRPSKIVVIAQRQIPHYRVPFLGKLRILLSKDGIDLRLITGNHYEEHLIPGDLKDAIVLPTRRIGPFLWNGFASRCKDADLVIIPQQIKQLDLFELWLRRRFQRKPNLALWGHGKNFQSSDQSGGKESIKRYLSKRVDWWFAYNDLSARVVSGMGFPAERITSVGNAIDSNSLAVMMKEVEPAEIERTKRTLKINTDQIAIYSGGLYSEKRIEFLISSAEKIRAKIDDFQLLIIGDGPERHLIEAAAHERSWIHWLGRRSGKEVMPYWAMSKVLLMPGLVGLVIVDSFALGVPIITTDYPYHSPEIDYLKHGINGLLVECGESADAYSDAVVHLMTESQSLSDLRNGALASAKDHTIEAMAFNFSEGIKKALSTPHS